MTEPNELGSTSSLVAPHPEQTEQAKLEKLRARLAAGEASPIVENSDPEEFLEEMYRNYGK